MKLLFYESEMVMNEQFYMIHAIMQVIQSTESYGPSVQHILEKEMGSWTWGEAWIVINGSKILS